MRADELQFSADLSTPEGLEHADLLPSPSLEAMCCNVYASIPDTAADMLRKGINPMLCAYVIRDEQGTTLLRIEFTELLRERRLVPPTGNRSDDQWAHALADLRHRCEAATSRLDRATAWMTRLTARALDLSVS